jgi:diaminohydroxyphosphoribosylaminopyrimidine deaminase/5-amino-6-(5-phosphoribosylamino)uracil reductase
VSARGAADDERWMARCLELARYARGRTAPNPIVGCVIVDRRGRVLAEGWHRGPGTAHGEADALARLGGRAPGATLYCNLEPCDHHGRTPPCSHAVIAAGVARVVIGALDPVPGHGGGAHRLAAAGIEVRTGVLEDACREVNLPFFTWAERGRPFTVLKAAVSLDGRVATGAGESRWVTGPAARLDGHRLRDELDAILVGVGTVLADDPRLTVRDVAGGRDPRRVIVDSRLRTPVTAQALAKAERAPIVATTARAAAARAKRLAATGAEVWRLPADRAGRVSLPHLLKKLAAAGVCSLLVEGGPRVHAALVAAKLVDELRLYQAPIVLGDGPAWLGPFGLDRLARAPRWRPVGDPVALGDDRLLRFRPA